MRIGNWQVDLISGGRFRIDGGVMYGIVPRSVWEPVAAPLDDQHRTLVDTHCVLARDGQHVVLIDTGYGGKHSPLERKVNDLQAGEPLLDALAALDVAPETVTHVLFTHLHFDHAGGATRRSPDRRLVPTFPHARHWVHRWEWQDATGGAAEIRAAFPQENLLPLSEAGLLEVFQEDGELLPGLSARHTGGHTRGHTCFWLEHRDDSLLFLGDLCPSAAHRRPQWHTSYELYPMETRQMKPRLLGEAADRGSWVVWNHDLTTPVSRVRRGAGQNFAIVDRPASL